MLSSGMIRTQAQDQVSTNLFRWIEFNRGKLTTREMAVILQEHAARLVLESAARMAGVEEAREEWKRE